MRPREVLVLALIASVGMPVGAADLGRLFFRGGERAVFDAARAAASVPRPTGTGAEAAAVEDAAVAGPDVPPEPAATVAVEGYVLRRRGDGTAWINGRSTAEEAMSAGSVAAGAVRLSRDGVVIETAAGVPRRLVKPGQSYDVGQDRVREAFEGPGAGGAPP